MIQIIVSTTLLTSVNNMTDLKVKSFQELLDVVGGTNQLALDLNVHRYTVDRWARNGFPEKYIIPICDKYKLEPGDLRKLRKKIRAYKRRDARIALLAKPL